MSRRYAFLTFSPGIDWQHVDQRLLADLNKLGAAKRTIITVTSGYRTYQHQADLYAAYVASGYNIKHIAAKPGHSAHEFGLAVDATINGRYVGQEYDAATLEKYGLAAPVKGDPGHMQFYGTTNDNVFPSWWKGKTSDTSGGSPPTQSQPTAAGYRPVSNVSTIIGRPYEGSHRLGNWESDNAVDIAVPIGTPVYAVTDGVIGSRFGSLGKGGRFAGLRLHLNATDGSRFYYAHLSKFAAGIKPGTKVTAGQLLGYTGEANGVAHLHFAVESGDPQKFLGGQAGTQTGQPADQTPIQPSTQPDQQQPASLSFLQSQSPVNTPQPEQTIPQLAAPGTQGLGITDVAQAWQQVAAQPMASPDSLSFAQQLAQATGTGG